MTQVIYKYLPTERLTYLEDELLRFTQPLDLNDPFEWMPILPSKEEIIAIIETVAKENIQLIENHSLTREKKRKAISDYTKKYKDSIKAVLNDEPNNFGEQFFNRAITSLGSKLGLFSLSRRWNSSLMWAHYTNSHKGFCIGFERNSDYFKTKGNPIDPIFIIQPVIYSENRIKVPVERGVKIDPKVVLTKSTDWKYEEEERVIALLDLADKTIEAKPYNICLFKIPHKTISEIIVGAKIEDDNLKVIHSFCRKNDIDLYRSRLSDTKFEMEREIIK
jgi:hypothetical protein